MPSAYAKPELLAEPAWVADNYNRPGVRIVDCRWRVDGSGRRRHAEGHVPGATYIDWAADLVDPDAPVPYQLASPAAFAGAMVAAAIGDGMTVVVLDDTYSLYAARVWWSLRAYGQQAAQVLNGGWPAWLDLGAPISTSATTADPVAFTPEMIVRRRVTAEQLAQLLGTEDVAVVDARTPAEYLGQGGPGPRRGHISGAVNLPAALLTEEGSQRIPSADTLAQLFGQARLDRNLRLITYDAIGLGAAKLAFCLELMGFEQVALYDGGWQDWAGRPAEDYPVEAS